jgi:hypothetical protein
VIITRRWLRFWHRGPGVAWKRADAELLFSERMGITKTVVAFGWRFKWLRACR